MTQKIKIEFKENGETRTVDVSNVRITDKDGHEFRITQDIEAGLEILGDSIGERMYVQPRTSNEVVILMR